jgi:hypothetical protein
MWVKHIEWTLHLCFPSLLTNTSSVKLSYLTIVVQIYNMSMEDVVLLPMFIVMMKSNAVLQPKLCLDWFTTFVVQVGIHVWFSFGINNISCCLSILIHAIKLFGEYGNANVVFFRDQSHFNRI